MTSLHIDYVPSMEVRQRLNDWDNAIRVEGQLREHNWGFLAIWSAARSATTSASTGIEGNPLTPDQVDDVIAGQGVEADDLHVREVANYHRAMEYVHRVATRRDFAWSHDVIQEVNARIMDGLPQDSRGRYRTEDVHVGIFHPPSGPIVDRLMDALVNWLGANRQAPLIRVALLHLNIIAIHPFDDGNGRTARALSAIELLRDGVAAPELVSTEPYFRQHRDEYVDMLRTVLGETYDPENHAATEWIDYFTRISLDRLSLRNRIRDSVTSDVGQIYLALAEANHDVQWATLLMAAAIRPLRTRDVTEWIDRSPATARQLLARIASAGWLRPLGRTRARRYIPGPRLEAIPLRVPDLTQRLRSGDAETQLEVWPEQA